jgi:hypothetical protein
LSRSSNPSENAKNQPLRTEATPLEAWLHKNRMKLLTVGCLVLLLGVGYFWILQKVRPFTRHFQVQNDRISLVNPVTGKEAIAELAAKHAIKPPARLDGHGGDFAYEVSFSGLALVMVGYFEGEIEDNDAEPLRRCMEMNVESLSFRCYHRKVIAVLKGEGFSDSTVHWGEQDGIIKINEQKFPYFRRYIDHQKGALQRVIVQRSEFEVVIIQSPETEQMTMEDLVRDFSGHQQDIR